MKLSIFYALLLFNFSINSIGIKSFLRLSRKCFNVKRNYSTSSKKLNLKIVSYNKKQHYKEVKNMASSYHKEFNCDPENKAFLRDLNRVGDSNYLYSVECKMLINKDNNRAVGFYHYSLLPCINTVELSYLVIDKKFQNLGLGSLFLGAIEGYCKKKKVKTLLGKVSFDNVSSRKMLEKNGFKHDKVIKEFTDNKGVVKGQFLTYKKTI